MNHIRITYESHKFRVMGEGLWVMGDGKGGWGGGMREKISSVPLKINKNRQNPFEGFSAMRIAYFVAKNSSQASFRIVFIPNSATL